MVVGQVVAGKYRLCSELGVGGMATVWSATNVFTERQFAIKFMHPELGRTAEAAARFLLEARVSARIDHANVIDTLDVGQAEDGTLFLVMELLSGVSLDTALHRSSPRMTLGELVLIAMDVARGLAAAHRNGVVHRDLKPSNIFLHEDREGIIVPKILDFGVSKIVETDIARGLTLAGTVLGSPLYMSPEQATGMAEVDTRTDIFSFGAILHEALVGARPFDAPNLNALIVTAATTEPANIDALAPHYPARLRQIIRACLMRDREHRPSNMDDVLAELSAVYPECKSFSGMLPTLPSCEASSTDAATRKSHRPPGSTTPTGNPSPSIHPTFSRSFAPPRRSLLERSWLPLVAGGALLATVSVIVGTAIGRRTESSRAAKAASSLSPAPLSIRGPASETRVEPPVLQIESLPLAARGRTVGKLSVQSSERCQVSIDGVKQGGTPIDSVEVNPGSHQLECVAPDGRRSMNTVLIPEGGTVRHRFAFER